MKRLLVAVIACVCLLPAVAQDDVLSSREVKKRADGMAQALVDNFWGASFKERPDRYYFNRMSQQADLGTGEFWPQAHAIDVITDVYLRSKDKKFYRLFDPWFQGMPRFNFGAREGGREKGDLWWNPFVDDMEWHCLALIRIYEATGEKRYLNKARQIYGD